MITVKRAKDLFVNAQDAVALLVLPGCYLLGINKIHFYALNSGGGRLITGAEFDRVISEPNKYVNHSCYCESIKAILALRGGDCVFETAFAALSTDQLENAYSVGFEFQLTQPPNGNRNYGIFRVHAALLDTPERNILIARLIATPFQMTVESSAGLGLNGSWTASIQLPGRESIFQTTLGSELDRDEVRPYLQFESALEQASEHPDDARKILESAALEIKDDGYAAVVDFVNKLEIEAWQANGALQRQIDTIRSQLWDAPAVAGKVRSRLEERAAEWLPDPYWNDPSDHDFSRVGVSPEQVERARHDASAFVADDVTGDESAEELLSKIAGGVA